ncbi:glycosyltransferase family 4 protein [Candidatus Nitrospira bockiana]
MKLLFVSPVYPSPSSPYTGAQNQRCVDVLREMTAGVTVLSPCPWVPPGLRMREKWRAYAAIPPYLRSQGVEVYRPRYPAIPGCGQSVWHSRLVFESVRALIDRLHERYRFDAVLSFDLGLPGDLAWRIGRRLGIVSAGWAVGSDVRQALRGSAGRRLVMVLNHLNFILYQTRELLDLGARLLSATPDELRASGRHRVLPRGVTSPRPPDRTERAELRRALGIGEAEVMALYVGRLMRAKGLFQFVDQLSADQHRLGALKVVLVGARRAFDETDALEEQIRGRGMADRIMIREACPPDRVWDYLAAADLFVFPSFEEGMPNALLEAMSAGVPAVTFEIKAIHDILRFDGDALATAKPYDFHGFCEAVFAVARDSELRRRLSTSGQALVQRHMSMQDSMAAVVQLLDTGSRPASREVHHA